MVNSVKKQPLNPMLLVSLLHSCKTAKQLRSVHGTMIVSGALRESETFLWNSLIKSYRHCCYGSLEPILLYHQMMRNGIVFDKFTFPFVIKACTNLRTIKLGQQIHGQVVKSRHVVDHFVQGCLVDMYAKGGSIEAARLCFDSMPYKNSVSWNSMIDGYVKHGDVGTARHLFDRMPLEERDLFSWNVMIDGYGKNGQVNLARELFDEMPEKDVVSWNSMMHGHAKAGNMKEAKELFDVMPARDNVSWGIMVSGYVNCGAIDMARHVLDLMPRSNLFSWNALIDGYAKIGSIDIMLELFEQMKRKNLVSWNIVLNAFAKCGDTEMACRMFERMPEKDIVSWNTMIDGYAKTGDAGSARKLFDAMPFRDVVSWNSIISAYKNSGCTEESVGLFHSMLAGGTTPDCSTLAVVLSAIADMGILAEGKWVHRYLERNQVPLSGNVGVALIDMYSKCGNLDIATEIFCSMPQKSVDHWNSMIAGHAVYGYGSYAIRLFEELQKSSVEPDDISFIAVLSACSHAGLVDEGHYYFNLMTLQYCLEPKIQHYGCLVDLLSRSGHVEEASLLVKNMPMKPNDVIWRALLGACKTHGNVVVGEEAANHLFELDPDDTSSYSLLSDMYGAVGRWDEALKTRETMKEKGIKKLAPGCSSIESDAIVHEVDATLPDNPAGHMLYHGAENTHIVSEKEQFVLERISKERTRLWFDTKD
ncbi:pentatricopeptide repeat-containing protein At2g45350, chloroplastic-like [Nymphaea colorata]|uniref:Uncharacterized protein n=1 Tax=Nymphaea colorata TaxID=210225 RepID=A0A5K1EGX4_9MAGN|nr:pentatricopeptide repeat-containing protein At2g45350, chloroplastic-like [Nymphaea colorata]